MICHPPFAIVASLARQLQPRKSAGHCDSYYGLVTRTGTRERDRAFIKIIDEARRDRALSAELLAFRLAKLFGLPVAPDVYVALCPNFLLDGRPGTRVSPPEFTKALVSVDAIGSGARTQDLDLKINVLRQWKFIERAAVFDELIFNEDRHINNLVHVGGNDLVLIDHEHAFGPVLNGEPERFVDAMLNGNPLVDFIASGEDQLRIRRMIRAAKEMAAQPIPQIEMPDDLRFCNLDEEDWSGLLSLVRRRQRLLESHIISHIEAAHRRRAFMVGS